MPVFNRGRGVAAQRGKRNPQRVQRFQGVENSRWKLGNPQCRLVREVQHFLASCPCGLSQDWGGGGCCALGPGLDRIAPL